MYVFEDQDEEEFVIVACVLKKRRGECNRLIWHKTGKSVGRWWTLLWLRVSWNV